MYIVDTTVRAAQLQRAKAGRRGQYYVHYSLQYTVHGTVYTPSPPAPRRPAPPAHSCQVSRFQRYNPMTCFCSYET
ncbi:unnamed protein product, partial [Brenthis ino]